MTKRTMEKATTSCNYKLDLQGYNETTTNSTSNKSKNIPRSKKGLPALCWSYTSNNTSLIHLSAPRSQDPPLRPPQLLLWKYPVSTSTWLAVINVSLNTRENTRKDSPDWPSLTICLSASPPMRDRHHHVYVLGRNDGKHCYSLRKFWYHFLWTICGNLSVFPFKYLSRAKCSSICKIGTDT